MNLLELPIDLYIGCGDTRQEYSNGLLISKIISISKYLDVKSVTNLALSCNTFRKIKGKMLEQININAEPKVEYLTDYQRLMIWKMYMMRTDMYNSQYNTIHYYPSYGIPELQTRIFMIFNEQINIDIIVEYLKTRIDEGELLDNYINPEGETFKNNDWIPYRRLIIEGIDDPRDNLFWENYYKKNNERWWKYPDNYNLQYNDDCNIELPNHNYCYDKCTRCSNIYDPIWCGKINNHMASGDWGILTGPNCSNRRTFWNDWDHTGQWSFENECRFIEAFIQSG